MASMSDHPGHETLRVLRSGETVDIQGIMFVMMDGEIKPGDLYIGARNTVQLLECKRVDNELGCIYPTTWDYPFDLHECIKVREA
jgi:hypothetical protein